MQAWGDHEGSKRLRLPDFLQKLHMNVARLSALRTGRLYPSGITPGTNLWWTTAVAQALC